MWPVSKLGGMFTLWSKLFFLIVALEVGLVLSIYAIEQ
jgi:hypothetical protein